jgi:hypothetical protein
MDRHAATRRLRRLGEAAGVPLPGCTPICCGTPSSAMLDAGVDLRDVQITARHADPRTTMATTGPARTLTGTRNYTLAAYMASGT